jgi:outer membrane protein assembly factor BamE (lipoprotein component of BamABCDE complex)
MRQRTIWTALVAAALGAAPLRAQDTVATAKPDTGAAAAAAPAQEAGGALKPGMTEADVRTLWGDPVAVRRMNDWTYLFFRNGRERRVGTYDVVFLQGGQVVDAIVRGAEHSYLGQSSSPEGRSPEYTPPQAAPPDSAAGAVTGVQVKPGK